MISVCTLDIHSSLEPGAPSPTIRLNTIKELSDAGFCTTLLCKPVIPGVNDQERHRIIASAKKCGAKNLVAGIMYVNNFLDQALQRSGFDTSRLNQRGTDKYQPIWVKNEIAPVKSHDLLDSIIEEARQAGLKAFKDSVCVISEDLKYPCPVEKAYPNFCSGH